MNGNFLSLASLIAKNNTTIKMSDYDFFEPAFLLGILSLYKSDIIKIECDNKNIENYLIRIDFHKYLGISCSFINRHKSNNLIEITPINKETSGKDTNEIAKKIIKNIGVKYEVDNKFIYGTLEWIFWELIDNSIQHSKADFEKGGSYFMLQSYPNRGELHICIVDNGIGIKESFRQSKYWDENKSDEYYIDLAFQRGKTSNSEIGAGNGLYWTKEIVNKTNSKLKYLSGKTLYTIDGEEKFFTQNDNWWQGVLLDIQIDLDNLSKTDIIEWLKDVGNNSSFIDQELDDKEYDDLFA